MDNNLHILVVEDEPDGAEVVSRILRFHNIDHEVASNAEDALMMLHDELPSAMIIDLALPGMDGWKLLRTLRDNDRTAHIAAIAVTAYHSSLVAQKAVQVGFDAYFSKPLDTTSFVRELERVVHERKQQEYGGASAQ